MMTAGEYGHMQLALGGELGSDSEAEEGNVATEDLGWGPTAEEEELENMAFEGDWG